MSFRRQQIIVLVLLLIAASVAIYKVTRPGHGTIRFEIDGQTASVYGGTDSSSYGVTKRFLDDNPQVRHLILKRMPGTVDADTNLRIARMIRKRGLTTHVQRRSYIASGAVDLFLSGAERTMDCGAKIGVHSWSYDSQNNIGVFSPKNLGTDRRQGVQEKFLRDMSIDPRFYAFTRDAADADEIYILLPKDVARFGLLTEDACRG
ncbi:MAG: hypothetical protein ABJ275_09935 [Maricaulaceae bacterium]